MSCRPASSHVAFVLPLHLRAPNPPEPFVGRADDLAWLRSRRVAVIAGPEGWGKTALVAQHLVGVKSALRFEPGPLVPQLVRGLALLSHVSASELGRTRPDEVLAQLIDLADAVDATLWIEDAGPDAAPFVALFARYARRARLYATTRDRLEGVAELERTPAPLSSHALTSLARSWEPGLSDADAERLARLAEGSPGRLRAAWLGAPSPSLSPEVARGLALLRACRVAVHEDALREILGGPVTDELRARHTVRHGPLLRATPGVAAAPDPKDVRALAAALLRHGGRPAQIEAGRLLLELGAEGDAAAALGAVLEPLIAEGYAPELWALLEPHHAPVLAPLRLRAAAEHGDAAALARLTEPGQGAPLATAFAWLKALYAREDHAAVRARGPSLAERAEAEGAAELAWELWLMSAAAFLHAGQHAEAQALAARARAPHERAASSLAVMRAILAAQRGEHTEALVHAEALVERLAALDVRSRGQLAYNVALVFYGLGRPDRAASLFEQVFPEEPVTEDSQVPRHDPSTSALASRRALELDAHLSVLGGRLGRARALLDRLVKFVVPGTPIEGRRVLMEATVDLLSGELASAAARVRRGAALAGGYGGREDLAYARTLEAQLALRSDAVPPEAEALPGGAAQTVSERAAAGWEALARVAHCGDGPAPLDAGADGVALAHAHALLRAVLAKDRAASERVVALRRARDEATSAPLRSALQLLCHQIEVLGAGRFADADVPAPERTLARAIVDADVAALVALARGHGGASSIASALLGGPPPASATCRRLLEVARAQLGWPGVVATDRGGAPLHLDVPRGRLFDGPQRIDLGPHPVLVRLFATLAVSGEAGKELLVRAVWSEVREYHPLKHDNRLRLAVRKLRQHLAPLGPELVVTQSDGYALARTVIVLGAP